MCASFATHLCTPALPHVSPEFVDKQRTINSDLQVSSISYIAKPILNAHDAIASLVRWNITLSLAVRMREPLSARAYQSIQFPEQCSIGKWLLSEPTLHLRRSREYVAVLDAHEASHRHMLCVANLINSADFEEAGRLLNSAEPFLGTSHSLANAIMAMDRISGAIEAPISLRVFE